MAARAQEIAEIQIEIENAVASKIETEIEVGIGSARDGSGVLAEAAGRGEGGPEVEAVRGIEGDVRRLSNALVANFVCNFLEYFTIK